MNKKQNVLRSVVRDCYRVLLNNDELLPDSWLVTFFLNPTPRPQEIYHEGGTGIVNMFLFSKALQSQMCDPSSLRKPFPQS